ncbi:unnamed protein product [Adineta steineri]|uniref:G-protein coupled receptors family 1 profile domain-containing protein n=1 Tax=Adineta steineri TaxID=433720 RepID=A0A814EU64_9BILA|nr:unnamed protein product [Adineta steineri]CAF3965267.1 unnamed protein product [Adineta steineri]
MGDETSSSYNYSSLGSATNIIQIVIASLTIVLGIGYIILILIRPILRHNKLNWFTINVCLGSIWLSTILLSMTILQLRNLSSSLSCRALTFLVDVGACQLMYSHCVIAISRLLTIVYGNKRLFLSNMCLWLCIANGWIVSVLAALPYLFIDGFLCFNSTSSTFLAYYTLITTLLFPVTIVTVCNIRILLFVRSSTRRVHGTGTVGGHVSHRRDVQLLKITIGTFVAFILISNLPDDDPLSKDEMVTTACS